MVKVTDLIRQKQVFLALMQNWKGVEDAVESAKNSLGSADEENEKYINSIQGKLENLESATQKLSKTLIDSDLVKFFVDLGTTGVKAIDGLVNALSPLGTGGLITGAILGLKDIGILKQSSIEQLFDGIDIEERVVRPFENAKNVISDYNEAIQSNSLTQETFEKILEKSDDSIKRYLENIKGTSASMTGYNVSLQGNITGFKKVSSAIAQYNELSTSGTKEQNIFANAVSVTNGKLGTYLNGLNGAKASLGGYVISLVGATAKTVLLKTATIALNSAITMGASIIISKIVKSISEWTHKTENMINASEDAVEKIKSINNELKNNEKTISDTAKRYAELAQGVDQLTGKNISLNTDDYKEFLSLSNQLADMFPTLTRNYTDNGDAIVQLSGDVDTIVGSLQNLIDAQRNLANRQIVDELPTVFDGVVAKSDKYESELEKLEDKKNALLQGLNDFTYNDLGQKVQEGLAEKYFEVASNDIEEYCRLVEDYTKLLEESSLKYSVNNLDPIWNGEYDNEGNQILTYKASIYIESSDEDIEKAKNIIDGKIQDLASYYETDIKKYNDKISAINEKNKSNWSSLSNSIFAWLSTDDSFKIMSEEMQSVVQNIVNSLDWEKLDFSSWEEAKQYIQENILSMFDTLDGEKTLEDIKVMFAIQTRFNNGEISVEKYQQKLQEFLSNIENLPPETKKSVLLLFGIKTNNDGTITSDIDTMIENVKKKLKDKGLSENIEKLSLGDLKIASELEIDNNTIQSWSELILLINEYKEAQKSANETGISTENFDELSSKISSSAKTVKANVKEIESSLKKLSKGTFTNSDLLDLLEKFPELDLSKVDLSNFNGLETVLKELENTQLDDLIDSLNKIGYFKTPADMERFRDMLLEIEEVNLSPVNDALNKAKDIEGTLGVLNETYKDFNDQKIISQDSLSKLQESFGNLDGFDNFISKITQIGVKGKDVESAFEGIIDEYLNTTDALENLNLGTVELIANTLKECGVVNGLDVILSKIGITTDEYSRIKQYATEKGIDLCNITYNEITALSDEKVITDETKQKLYEFALQKEILNGITIKTDGDIQNLQNLVTACGGTIESLKRLATAKSLYDKVMAGDKGAIEMAAIRGIGDIETWYQGYLDDVKQDLLNQNFGSGNASNSSNYVKPNFTYSGGEKKQKKIKKEQTDSKSEFDFVEIKLNNLNKQLDKQKEKAEKLYSTYNNQNEELGNTIGLINSQITEYETAYDTYMSKAKSVKLDKDIKKKIREGSLTDISSYDSDTIDAINEYQKWYDKAQDVKKTISELRKEQKELSLQKTDNIQDDYDKKIEYRKSLISTYEAELEYRKAIGEEVTEDDYNYLINKQEELKSDLQNEYDLVNSEFESLIKEGKIHKYSDNWFKFKSFLSGLKNEIVDCDNEIVKLKNTAKEFDWSKVEKIQNKYNNKVNYNESLIDSYKSDLDYRKSIGEQLEESDYDYLIKKQKKIKSDLRKEYDEINAEFEAAMKSGKIEKYDDNWFKFKEYLVGIESSIDECDESIREFTKDASQVKWDNFNNGLTYIKNINSEIQSLIGLFDSDNVFDENGNYTENGISLLALYQEQLKANEIEIQKYNDAIAMLDEELRNGDITQEQYTESLNEYRSAQYSLISSTNSVKKTLVDFRIQAIEENQKAVEESINSETDKMKELIQSKKDALQAEKDLNDYKESIAKKQKNIATLSSKIAQLERSESAKDRALARELRADLAQEEEDLQKEISDHNLDTQLDALDDELEAFEDAQDKKIKELSDSTDEQIKLLKTSATEQQKVINEMLQVVTDNYTTAFENITNIASEYGIEIAKAITDPLKDIELFNNGNMFSQENEVMSILKNGKGTGGASSELNKYVMSTYGDGSKYLSYAQMSQLASLLGLGDYSAKDFKGNNFLKNELLNAIKGMSTDKTGNVRTSSNIDKILEILENGKGTAGVNSDLNEYVMSTYGGGKKYLSYKQMAELAKLLGMGEYDSKEFKGNSSLKSKLLAALRNAKFADGGEISSNGNVFGNDNILLRAKKGEFVLTQDMTKHFKQFVNNLPQLNTYNNILNNIGNSIKIPNGMNGGVYNIGSLLNIENVEGDVGSGVERKIESMLGNLDIEKQLNKIVNKYK